LQSVKVVSVPSYEAIKDNFEPVTNGMKRTRKQVLLAA